MKMYYSYIGETTILVSIKPKNWVKETYGIHKKIWQGVDAIKYIRTLREEWTKKHF